MKALMAMVTFFVLSSSAYAQKIIVTVCSDVNNCKVYELPYNQTFIAEEKEDKVVLGSVAVPPTSDHSDRIQTTISININASNSSMPKIKIKGISIDIEDPIFD